MTKFSLGTVYLTNGVHDTLATVEILKALRRHAAGDWGDVTLSDAAENDYALANERRLFSVYKSKNGILFYIITEYDRSSTTVLLPNEY